MADFLAAAPSGPAQRGFFGAESRVEGRRFEVHPQEIYLSLLKLLREPAYAGINPYSKRSI